MGKEKSKIEKMIENNKRVVEARSVGNIEISKTNGIYTSLNLGNVIIKSREDAIIYVKPNENGGYTFEIYQEKVDEE